MVLVDVWSEYAGTIVYKHFRPFRKHTELFDGGNWYRELALVSAGQLAIEIVTDTTCT